MRHFLLFGIAAAFVAPTYGIAQGVHENISGDVFLALSPISSEPVHWRGKGPNRGWDMGLDLVVQRKRYELFFNGMVAGGAPFDNPERVQFNFGAGARLTKRLLVFADIFNLYSLNDRPVVDRGARTPTSGINQTWLKARYEFPGTERRNIKAYYGHGIRGDLSLYFPVDHKSPYVSQYAAGEIRQVLWKGIAASNLTEAYYNDEFDKAHFIFRFGLERGFFGQIVARAELFLHKNVGVPDGRLDAFGRELTNRELVRLSIYIPFGKIR